MDCSHQASLYFTISRSWLKLVSVMPPNHLALCCPFLLLPSVFPSIRVFSDKSVLSIRWPNCWSFSSSYGHLLKNAAADGICWYLEPQPLSDRMYYHQAELLACVSQLSVAMQPHLKLLPISAILLGFAYKISIHPCWPEFY